MITLYGIRNCDTCRKAWKWLDGREVEYRFHDLQRDGVDRTTVDQWMDAVGELLLVNRKGRTWRALPPEQRAALDDAGLRRLMTEQPTVIKRPVVVWSDGRTTVGFDPARWEKLIS